MRTPQITEIADGLRFPEGPVAMADGSVLVVELAGGCITRVQPDGAKSTVATPGGSPNGWSAGSGTAGAGVLMTGAPDDRRRRPGGQRVIRPRAAELSRPAALTVGPSR